jgi:hypothetical protein
VLKSSANSNGFFSELRSGFSFLLELEPCKDEDDDFLAAARRRSF